MMKTLIPFASLFAVFHLAAPYLQANPIFNEVMSANRSSLQDEDQEFVDWIEFFNPTGDAVNMDGMYLSDAPENPERWQFPEVEIPANGYLIVFASGKDRTDPEGKLHTNFRLNSGGETITLLSEDANTTIAELQVAPLNDDESFIALETTGGGYTYEVTDQPTPEASNNTNVVLFSQPSQTFTGTMTLELSTPSAGSIRYSEDGKVPTLFSGKTYSGPIEIDETVIITASTGGGPVRSESFIKLADELADRDSNIPLVIVDTFGDGVARKDGPPMTNMAIGFQDVSEDGRSQIVGPLETNSRGGIRRRGQSSSGFAKFPMRLELWNHENDDDLPREGRDRTLAPLGFPANSDFILNARFTFDRALIRNTWIMELSNQIDRYAVRTRHVELYLNDDGDDVEEEDYFGVYTFMETVKRAGDRVDLPAMAASDTEAPEITGGYIFKKDKSDPGIWNFNAGGVPLQMVYPTEAGRSERGHQEDFLQDFLNDFASVIDNPDPVEGYPAYIDVGSFIDHHWLNVIPLNVDAMRISGYFYKERDSEEGVGKVGAGPIWDYDRSAGSTDGRTTTPELWRGRGGDNGTHFFRSALGEPRWWEDLFDEREFVQQWIDRWHELREDAMVTTDYDDTPMPAFSIENISRIIEHQGAVIGESGDRNFDRWGPQPAGRHEGQVDRLREWMETRMEWIESQLVTVPTYTPAESTHENPVMVTLKAPPSSVFNPLEAYFTTDGSDPRAVGGEPSANAVEYDGPFEVTETTRLIARKFDDSHKVDANGPPNVEWSAPGEFRYFVGEEPAAIGNITVAEVMYHPAAPTDAEVSKGYDDDDRFEFIELLNIGTQQVNLSGARLRGDADFNFPENTRLAPGQRLVIVENEAAFDERYGAGINVVGAYTGNLGNADGRILLRAHDDSVILEFTYLDEEPWPEEADGDGRALVLNSAESNPDTTVPGNWQAGTKDNGTPGAAESGGGGPVEPTGGYADFLAVHFDAAQQADATLSGPDADAENDGLPTLAEYVLDGDPWQADGDKAPAATRDENGLSVTYTRKAGLTDVDITVEVSTDLVSWTEFSSEESVIANGASETVTLVESGDGVQARYARLKITQR